MNRKQRKRGQGEGSIYRRKDGRWVGVVNLGYHDGKRARKSVYGATQAEVIEQMAEARKAAREGTLVVDERQTVAQFLGHWLAEAVEKSVRPSTFRRYSDLVRLHIIPELGRIRLTKLTPQHVQALLNAKLGGKAASRERCGRPADDGLSARTVHHIHGVLRTALGQALKWGLVSRNVATLVSPPRVPHTEIRPLNVTEARKLLGEIKGHRFEPLFVTALATGMRQGELLGLAWEDVDCERRTLRVRQSLQRIEGKLEIVEVKTAKGRRTVALPGLVVEVLQRHSVAQKEQRLLAGSKWTESGLVFTTKVGTPLCARNVLKQFKDVLTKAELPEQRFHDLRHGAASLLLAQGVSAREIMEILGHSQIGITMNLYSHVMPEVLHDAAAKLNRVLSSPQLP